jgi:hypothetical protein
LPPALGTLVGPEAALQPPSPFPFADVNREPTNCLIDQPTIAGGVLRR